MGDQFGLIGSERLKVFHVKQSAIEEGIALFQARSLTPNEAQTHGIAIKKDGRRRTAFELLSYKDVSFDQLAGLWPEFQGLEPAVAKQVEIEARYAVYLERQEADIAALRKDEALAIPSGFDYGQISGLSTELKSKLELHAPETLAQASRIDGMTPAALMLVLAHVKRGRKFGNEAAAG